MSVRAGASKGIRNATAASRRAMGRRGNETARANSRANQVYTDTVPF